MIGECPRCGGPTSDASIMIPVKNGHGAIVSAVFCHQCFRLAVAGSLIDGAEIKAPRLLSDATLEGGES